MPICVTHLTGRRQGLKVVLAEELAVLGRDPSRANVTFDLVEDKVVSGLHARIFTDRGLYWVEDCESLNGTFLDGREVLTAMQLPSGSTLQLGGGGPSVRVDFEPAAVSSPPSQSPWIVLERLDDENVGVQTAFGGQSITLGRDASCDMAFGDDMAKVVSRRHARIMPSAGPGRARIQDTKSQNGTFVNGKRIKQTELFAGDLIELGESGPRLRVTRLNLPGSSEKLSPRRAAGPSTVAIGGDVARLASDRDFIQDEGNPAIPIRTELMVGRSQDCGFRVESPAVSSRHALFKREGSEFSVRDYQSTNGTFVNGKAIGSGRHVLHDQDLISLGGQVLLFQRAGLQRLRLLPAIQAFGLCRPAQGAAEEDSEGPRMALHNVSLEVSPGRLVGILGPAGAGKTALLEALSGLSPAQWGKVYLCGISLYDDCGLLRGRLGYVPLQDLLHEALTVRQCLEYSSLLRLPSDTSRVERLAGMTRVLSRLGLEDLQHARIATLGRGEKKRVSLALELLADPDILFLDDPASGLDPKTEQQMMQYLRELTQAGKTVVLVTHMFGSVDLLDQLCVLVKGGRLAFVGSSRETLEYFQVTTWKDLYCKLEDAAEDWAERFRGGTTGRLRFDTPTRDGGPKLVLGSGSAGHGRGKSSVLGTGSVGGVWSIALQSSALSRRFARTALADRGNIAALLLSPLGLIAVAASVGAGQNFAISVLLILALFFGGSCSSRELVRERDIFKRERLYGLSHSAWVLSKALVLTVPVLLQAAGMIEMGRLCGIFSGSAWALWAATALAGLIGMSEGLFISALSGSVDISQGALFLFITLQLLFSGVVGSPPETAMSELLQQSQVASAARKAAFLANPAYWALDAMHRGCLTGGEMPINPPADPESLGQEVALEKHLAGMPAAIQAVETAQIQELQAADAGGKGVGYHARRKELRADAERKLKALSSVGELLRVDVGQLERSHRVHFISGSSLDDDCWILVMFVVVFILLTITVLAMQEAWRRTG